MANIFKSSIGKKLIMSVTGLFLILFLTLHMCLNLVSVFSPDAFEGVCEFMGLPIVGIMVPVLAAGFVIHIIYASILTLGNYKARGSQRYAVSNKAKTDSWSSRNMFVLGSIVVLGLALHLTHFWSKMQLQEWMGNTPANPNLLLERTFGSVIVTIIYVVWFVALWFHLTHGFWSAFQTIGWNNNKWLVRTKWICNIVVTLLMLGFTLTAVVGCARANGCIDFPKTENCCGDCDDDCDGKCGIKCDKKCDSKCDKACDKKCSKACGDCSSECTGDCDNCPSMKECGDSQCSGCSDAAACKDCKDGKSCSDCNGSCPHHAK